MKKRLDIIGVGESGVDLTFTVKQMPERGGKARARQIGIFPGGMIGNFCTAAAKQGLTCGIMSAVGNDGYGRLIAEDYQQAGVETEKLAVIPGAPTFSCFVFLQSDGEKYLFTIETTPPAPQLEKVDFSYLRQARYVHLNAMDYLLAQTVTSGLTGSGTQVSLDYEAHAQNAGLKNWACIFQRVSVLFLNRESGLQLLGTDPEKHLSQLLDYGPKLIVLTLGEQGGILCRAGQQFSYAAIPVDSVVDTTGAGDCFNASLLGQLIRGAPLPEAARYAAAAAALSIRQAGARGGQPTQEEIWALLARYAVEKG